MQKHFDGHKRVCVCVCEAVLCQYFWVFNFYCSDSSERVRLVTDIASEMHMYARIQCLPLARKVRSPYIEMFMEKFSHRWNYWPGKLAFLHCQRIFFRSNPSRLSTEMCSTCTRLIFDKWAYAIAIWYQFCCFIQIKFNLAFYFRNEGTTDFTF